MWRPGRTASLSLLLCFTPIWLTFVSAQICTMTSSVNAKAAALNIVTDRACSKTGVGCLSTICRYCRLPQATSYTSLLWCSQVTGVFSTLPTPAPTTVSPAFMLACSTVASAGDATVGIAVINDVSCVLGGLGCIGNSCRQCRVFNTLQSAHLVACNKFRLNNGADIQFKKIPSIWDNSGLPGSRASPVYSNSKPTVITFPTSAPVFQPASVAADPCSFQVARGDTVVGISAATDPTCSKGGVGCFSLTCRYCQNYYTESSAHLLPCSTFKLEALAKSGLDKSEPREDESEALVLLLPISVGGVIAVFATVFMVRKRRLVKGEDIQANAGSESPSEAEEPPNPSGPVEDPPCGPEANAELAEESPQRALRSPEVSVSMG